MRTDDSGRGVERMFYSAYGQPECFPFGDVDGDYDVDTADATALAALIGTLVSSDVNILADLNLDGLITQADLNLLNANYIGHTGGANVLSVDSEANDVGYAGYVWNDETTQWHVRNRELSPKLGRWLQRDRFMYADGLNLYTYGVSQPLTGSDPSGRIWVQPRPVPGGDTNRDDDYPVSTFTDKAGRTCPQNSVVTIYIYTGDPKSWYDGHVQLIYPHGYGKWWKFGFNMKAPTGWYINEPGIWETGYITPDPDSPGYLKIEICPATLAALLKAIRRKTSKPAPNYRILTQHCGDMVNDVLRESGYEIPWWIDTPMNFEDWYHGPGDSGSCPADRNNNILDPQQRYLNCALPPGRYTLPDGHVVFNSMDL